jgi:hypothetical protein
LQGLWALIEISLTRPRCDYYASRNRAGAVPLPGEEAHVRCGYWPSKERVGLMSPCECAAVQPLCRCKGVIVDVNAFDAYASHWDQMSQPVCVAAAATAAVSMYAGHHSGDL